MAVARDDPFGKSSLDNTTGLPFARLRMNATEAVVKRQILIYRADAGWVASLAVCSSVLLLLGLFSFALSLRVTAPDIFNHVSSLTRDNPFIKVPDGGSALDGSDRARLLSKLPVQLGDADSAGETGYYYAECKWKERLPDWCGKKG